MSIYLGGLIIDTTPAARMEPPGIAVAGWCAPSEIDFSIADPFVGMLIDIAASKPQGRIIMPLPFRAAGWLEDALTDDDRLWIWNMWHLG